MTYPIEAEAPVIAVLEQRDGWLNVSPTAVTTAVLSALTDAGWGITYPRDFPGLCSRCRHPVAAGTVHEPFNGNQMFACQVRDV